MLSKLNQAPQFLEPKQLLKCMTERIPSELFQEVLQKMNRFNFQYANQYDKLQHFLFRAQHQGLLSGGDLYKLIAKYQGGSEIHRCMMWMSFAAVKKQEYRQHIQALTRSWITDIYNLQPLDLRYILKFHQKINTKVDSELAWEMLKALEKVTISPMEVFIILALLKEQVPDISDSNRFEELSKPLDRQLGQMILENSLMKNFDFFSHYSDLTFNELKMFATKDRCISAQQLKQFLALLLKTKPTIREIDQLLPSIQKPRNLTLSNQFQLYLWESLVNPNVKLPLLSNTTADIAYIQEFKSKYTLPETQQTLITKMESEYFNNLPEILQTEHLEYMKILMTNKQYTSELTKLLNHYCFLF